MPTIVFFTIVYVIVITCAQSANICLHAPAYTYEYAGLYHSGISDDISISCRGVNCFIFGDDRLTRSRPKEAWDIEASNTFMAQRVSASEGASMFGSLFENEDYVNIRTTNYLGCGEVKIFYEGMTHAVSDGRHCDGMNQESWLDLKRDFYRFMYPLAIAYECLGTEIIGDGRITSDTEMLPVVDIPGCVGGNPVGLNLFKDPYFSDQNDPIRHVITGLSRGKIYLFPVCNFQYRDFETLANETEMDRYNTYTVTTNKGMILTSFGEELGYAGAETIGESYSIVCRMVVAQDADSITFEGYPRAGMIIPVKMFSFEALLFGMTSGIHVVQSKRSYKSANSDDSWLQTKICTEFDLCTPHEVGPYLGTYNDNSGDLSIRRLLTQATIHSPPFKYTGRVSPIIGAGLSGWELTVDSATYHTEATFNLIGDELGELRDSRGLGSLMLSYPLQTMLNRLAIYNQIGFEESVTNTGLWCMTDDTCIGLECISSTLRRISEVALGDLGSGVVIHNTTNINITNSTENIYNNYVPESPPPTTALPTTTHPPTPTSEYDDEDDDSTGLQLVSSIMSGIALVTMATGFVVLLVVMKSMSAMQYPQDHVIANRAATYGVQAKPDSEFMRPMFHSRSIL